jgi:ribosomal protein S1
MLTVLSFLSCFFSFQVVDAKVIHLDYNNSRIFLSLKDVKVMDYFLL